MKNIALLSHWDDSDRDLFNVLHASRREYCERHGYMLMYDKNVVETYRDTPWDKIKGTVRLLTMGFDAVMWLRAEALITNHTICIEDRLKDSRFVIGADLFGLNNGAFIAVNTPLTKQLFLAINNGGSKYINNHVLHDQESFNRYLFMTPYADLGTFFTGNEILAYVNAAYSYPTYVTNDWQVGDWLLHFPNLPIEVQKQLVTVAATQTIR